MQSYNVGDFGNYPNSKTTGASGSTSHANNDGLVTGSFETAPVTQDAFKGKGSNGGQNPTDTVSVTHNAFAEDMYVTDSENFGVSRVGNGIEGQSGNKTTGAGEGTPGHVHGWSK